jgi:pilus assembly protein Flp/PilA
MELRATERRTSMVVSFIRAKLGEFVRNESGATAIEYGLIAALIALAIIAAVTLIGTNLDTLFRAIAAVLVPPT